MTEQQKKEAFEWWCNLDWKQRAEYRALLSEKALYIHEIERLYEAIIINDTNKTETKNV